MPRKNLSCPSIKDAYLSGENLPDMDKDLRDEIRLQTQKAVSKIKSGDKILDTNFGNLLMNRPKINGFTSFLSFKNIKN